MFCRHSPPTTPISWEGLLLIERFSVNCRKKQINQLYQCADICQRLYVSRPLELSLKGEGLGWGEGG